MHAAKTEPDVSGRRRLPLLASPLAALPRGLAADVAHLFREIYDFTLRSARAGEAGWKPWIQAIVVGLVFGAAAGGVALAGSARPVAAPLVGSYWLTRVLCVRWLAAIYLIAFLVALFQNKELIGDRGITPVRCLLARADSAVEASLRQELEWCTSRWTCRARRAVARVEMLPTLLWLAPDRRRLDRWLDGLAAAGAVLAALALVRGGASAWQLLGLWALYHSINAVGQRWYSFGWEAQLLETGLLALLAAPAGLLGCPAPGAALAAGAPVPMLAVWAFRWMAFRIMLGAGLIKLRGAKCWLDLTAMCHHLETQPIPNPLTRSFHLLPRPFLLFATASNHVIELFAPWLLLLPFRPFQAAFGATHVVFQLTLILTGNLSFLNWLTVIPGLWCFDDAMLVGLLPEAFAAPLAEAVVEAAAATSTQQGGVLGSWLAASLGSARSLLAFAIIAWLSAPVWANLLGSRGGGRQRMNSSFERWVALPGWLTRALGLKARTPPVEATASEERQQQASRAQKRRRLGASEDDAMTLDLRSLRLLNTYGAFGSVNRERVEIVFEGWDAVQGEWRPYTFKAAVDDPYKRPRWLAPYHLRLDWCRWIASCRGRRANGLEEQWVLAFAGKLLLGDQGTRRLLARGGDPFEGSSPPPLVRAGLYLYTFAAPPLRPEDPYWLRERVGEYLPPLTLRELAPKLLAWGLLEAPAGAAPSSWEGAGLCCGGGGRAADWTLRTRARRSHFWPWACRCSRWR